MSGLKPNHIRAADRIGRAKKKLLKNLFRKSKTGRDFIGFKDEMDVCAKCRDPRRDLSAASQCAVCDGTKLPACDHLKKIRTGLFAFDLCAPEWGSDKKKMPTTLGNRKSKRNMDIFTAQRIAAERATALHNRLLDRTVSAQIDEYFDLVDKIHSDLDAKSAKLDAAFREAKYIQITMVGASVTGLTFHATLVDLLHKYPVGSKRFDDIFSIKFIDLHKRPLERLMQARDRTVVPRFEYERIFKTDFSQAAYFDAEDQGFEPGWYTEAPRFLTAEQAADKWIDTHKNMPPALRWLPGRVRDVAVQIANGHKAWMKEAGPSGPMRGLHQRDTYDSLMQNMNAWFVGIEPPRRLRPDKPDVSMMCMFGVQFNKYISPNDKFPISRIEDNEGTQLHGDILFRATGLGIDISGDQPDELAARKAEVCHCDKGKVFDFPSVQRSYWDPVKPELDLPEETANQILVMGNSDAAAGALFSTLLNHFDSCTFAVLAELVWKRKSETELTSLQLWFRDLSSHVKKLGGKQSYRHVTDDETGIWTRALHEASTLRLLYDTEQKFVQKLNFKRELEEQLIRSGRSLYLGVRWDERTERKPYEKFKSNYDRDKPHKGTNLGPDERYLHAKFLIDAWPENRLLGALINTQISVLLFDYGATGVPPFNVLRNHDRQKKTYRVKGKFRKLAFGPAVAEDYTDADIELKYVINCGGAPYFQIDGNKPIKAKAS